MLAAIGAELVFALHFAFILFVPLGGVLALKWPRIAWLHVPCALWGAGIILAGGICPLTPLENALREAAGQAGYDTGFIDHYIAPIIYPAGLTREVQIAIGAAAVAINLLVYGVVWLRRRRMRGRG